MLDLIHTVMHQYRSMQYQALRDGPHDITHMEGKVLGFFGHHPGATQSDLAKHSGRDKAQLARLIKGLRDRGLLDAVADESDKRNVRLTLTSDGQSVLTVLRQQAKRLNTLALQEMDSHEQEQLQQLLQRVKVNLDAGS
ncbi:MarR family winged helix-turn-helix transcriptional regulator [Undibacterium umbellatum]|uniref:MarR family winged helix-turn-helix transcriptional regulator n=1 Tax=Undibacterium umbellatum TaxID=2762300 RepID=UPI002E32327E|nr:MarR family transcriptional regulator [Undibacterium umbellatum]